MIKSKIKRYFVDYILKTEKFWVNCNIKILIENSDISIYKINLYNVVINL